MNARSLMLGVFTALLSVPFGSAVAQPAPKERLMVKLTDEWVELMGEDTMMS